MLPFDHEEIDRVEFYKRDELTSDLICCDVISGTATFWSHEEAPAWDQLIAALNLLPGFDADWYSKVSQPPFAECRTTAFARA